MRGLFVQTNGISSGTLPYWPGSARAHLSLAESTMISGGMRDSEGLLIHTFRRPRLVSRHHTAQISGIAEHRADDQKAGIQRGHRDTSTAFQSGPNGDFVYTGNDCAGNATSDTASPQWLPRRGLCSQPLLRLTDILVKKPRRHRKPESRECRRLCALIQALRPLRNNKIARSVSASKNGFEQSIQS